MSIRNNKKIIFGALSAVVASVAAGVLVKNNIDKKASNQGEKKKEKKSKNVYYTVYLNDIYNPYDDKTMSEDDMIEEIKKEGKYKINPDVNIPFNHGMHLVVLGETEKMAKVFK